MQQDFLKGSSIEFAASFAEQFPAIDYSDCTDEAAIFKQAGLNFIPACQRESIRIIEKAKFGSLPPLLETTDIKGIIHSHSNWSDGSTTIEEMAKVAQSKGFEYLVISDHSKSAFYANGLQPERIKEQHLYIDS
jgi:DNA polymerase (family 10)